jgi:hypothetical protein
MTSTVITYQSSAEIEKQRKRQYSRNYYYRNRKERAKYGREYYKRKKAEKLKQQQPKVQEPSFFFRLGFAFKAFFAAFNYKF